jgi:hypothetical protein
MTMAVSRLSRRTEVAGSLAFGVLAFAATYLTTIHTLVFMSHWQ